MILETGGRKLETIFKRGQAAFMPYICCGDPYPDFTVKAIKTLVAAGADAIELGIPFSDPIADGRTIQAASARALESGMTPEKALDVLRTIRREGIDVSVILMTYYNIVLANGNEKFLRTAKEAGAEALIVPDVPLEESEGLQAACSGAGLKLIRMVSVSCSEVRLKVIAERAEGFLYVVGALGTTGVRESVSEEASDLVRRVKCMASLPVAVGFGISKPEHAAALKEAGADGIIVGSAIADVYSRYIKPDGTLDEDLALAELEKFAKAMKVACVTRGR
jgi:tryptophan synthase alpha chain